MAVNRMALDSMKSNKDYFGTRRRRLGIDHPVVLIQPGAPACEGRCVREASEFASAVGRTQARQELAAIDAAKHSHRQEEPRPATPPLGLSIHLTVGVAGKTAGRHQAMHVRMQVQILPPGVQRQ